MPIGSPNAGYRTFTTGDVLTAAQVQFNLQNQTIMYFANAAARDAALTVGTVQEGMFAYLADTNSTVFYDGAAWQGFGTGDVTGLTAGNGITILSPTGPVPTVSVSDNATLVSPIEQGLFSATAANGAINIDAMVAGVNIRTSNATANYQLNIRGDAVTTLDSIMVTGESLTITFESPNGGTAYYATAVTIDGSAPASIKWLGGSAPSSGNINSTDVYMLQIRKTAAATFTCIASQSKFA
jgi:hypothetical protein